MDVRSLASIEGCDRSRPFTAPRVLRAALWAALSTVLSTVLVACGGSDPTDDEVALGTGQSGNGGSSALSLDFPIFYVKRPVPDVDDPDFEDSNVLEIRQFEPDADLYMRTSASPSAPETNLTGQLTNHLGDVRDLDVSYDGRKVIFSMRFPFD